MTPSIEPGDVQMLATAVAALRDAYPRQTFPDASVEMYVRMLVDLPAEDVALAVSALIARSSWLPTISEIRRQVIEATLRLPGPAEAWEQIQTADGRRSAPALVRRALALVGGPHAIRSTDAPSVLAGQFRKHYEELRETEIRERAENLSGSVAAQIGIEARAAHEIDVVPELRRIDP